MTEQDAKKSTEYSDKYGKYIHNVWDIFNKDIMSQTRFLELLPIIYKIAAVLPRSFKAEVVGAPLETLLQLKFYVFNGLQQQSLLTAKTFIKETLQSIMKTQGLPQFDNFQIFIKSFKYNYPYKDAVITAVDRWKTHLSYLQKEILENLIILDSAARKSYLKRLQLDCENQLTNAQVTAQDLQSWLTQYDTTIWEIVDPHPFIATELNQILSSEPETFKESFKPGINPSATNIRYAFYNYFYGYYLGEALFFIDEQDDAVPKTSDIAVALPKLKSKLTVPQLSYLFKLLMDEDLFDYKTKTEVYRFIAAVFETNKASNISLDSVKNNMDNPDAKSIDAIQGKLMRILQTIQKDKKNLGR